MTGLLLHLAGPLQCYGSLQGGRVRDTLPHPTRSALAGMFAAALGRPRRADTTDLDALTHTIRVDRPGERLRDWHTIGGGCPKARTVLTADGSRRGEAVLYEDYYLSDAAFTVAVTGPKQLIATVAAALTRPVFPPYLGRRSCPPSIPVLLGQAADPVAELDHIPLHRPKPRSGDVVHVLFLTEQPPADAPDWSPTREVQDVPLPAAGTGRDFTTRPSWEITRTLPATLCAGYGTRYLTALTRHRSTAA